MNQLRINRAITGLIVDTTSQNHIIYFLNHRRVFIGLNGRFVSVDGNEIYTDQPEPLIKFATEMGNSLFMDSGKIKFDSNSIEINNFLKLTRCI